MLKLPVFTHQQVLDVHLLSFTDQQVLDVHLLSFTDQQVLDVHLPAIAAEHSEFFISSSLGLNSHFVC